MTIKAGSFSRIDVYESCALRAKFAFVDKIPEPERPLPPGKTEHANDRGSRIHEHADRYVKGLEDTQLPEMAKFATEFERLRALHDEGRVLSEEMWCFDESWAVCGDRDWDAIKFRIKTDATVFLTDTAVVVIDFKTGKRWGNEVKHAQQAQLYALGVALRYEEIETINTELWYLDLDEMHPMTMRRDQALRFFASWDTRNQALMACDDFQPRPSKDACRWCPYSKKGTGHCTIGVV
ncbi:MAG: RecB family exonuclease [bacterium]